MQALFTTGQSTTPFIWREVDEPALIEPTDALVRPLAVAACDLDRALSDGHTLFPGEYMIGHEFTGEVFAVGAAIVGGTIWRRSRQS